MLTGEAKKAYQREYMRDWQRKRRSKQVGSKQNKPEITDQTARSSRVGNKGYEGILSKERQFKGFGAWG